MGWDGVKITSRMMGTNPRAMGTNPRALGTNPRAMEVQMKSKKPKGKKGSSKPYFGK